MKIFFTVLGIAGLLVVALTFTNVAAQSPQPGSQGGAAETPIPQAQNGIANYSQMGWGMGHGMMGGHRGARSGMLGTMPMHDGTGMMPVFSGTTAGSGYPMFHENMSTGGWSMMWGAQPTPQVTP